MNTNNADDNRKTIGGVVSWLQEGFMDDMTPLVKNFLETTGKYNFDTIVGTGLSGTLVVPYIARALGLNWAIVRKDDHSHSTRKVEGFIGKRWVFVDDFISSGATLERVREEIDALARRSNFETEYVGTFEYRHNTFQPALKSYEYTVTRAADIKINDIIVTGSGKRVDTVKEIDGNWLRTDKYGWIYAESSDEYNIAKV